MRLLHPGLHRLPQGPAGPNEEPTAEEVEEAISGNICRCTGYTKIFDAVELAAKQMS